MENRGPVNYAEPVELDGRDEISNLVKTESLENGDDYQEANPAFTISEVSKQSLLNILDQIKVLTPIQKFLLFLKLDEEITNTGDPLKQSMNPLGSRSEVCRTISWIKTHLEEDPDISLPKQQVYDEYIIYCSQIRMKPLSQADFGKVMKQVYPNVKARRLGTRGNSRYCYSGLRNCTKLCIPSLPDLGVDKSKPFQIGAESIDKGSSLKAASWLILKEWAERQFNSQFASLETLAFFLVVNCSVGVGTEAAAQIASFSMSSMPDEMDGARAGETNRELQMHLQKKLGQKEEAGKERKRKSQTPKTKPMTPVKRVKSSLKLEKMNASPSESGSTSSTNSPTEGAPVCDKYQDYNKTATLPDFNCFQKTASAQPDDDKGRIKARPKASVAKYKQPKLGLQLCDTPMYNPLPVAAADDRSQNCQILCDNAKRDVDDFHDDLCLPRERLESISNVDKDAMDDYLGKSNSQHEEELSKYFNNEPAAQMSEAEPSCKMFQLRQLLHEHLRRNATGMLVAGYDLSAPTASTLLPSNPVPFEAQPTDKLVSPAVNKHFSFAPISPKEPSNGRRSKCSSANASPFVSPRNTPVPRCRNYQGLSGIIQPNLGPKLLASHKVKKELDPSPDPLDPDPHLPIPNKFYSLSPPPSPLVAPKSLLQTLLGSKAQYAQPPYQEPIKQENFYRSHSFDFPMPDDKIQLVDQLAEPMYYPNFVGSRSVPNTPLGDEPLDPISHSYPSTPLLNEPFVYNGADCLLNGQLIKNDDTIGIDYDDTDSGMPLPDFAALEKGINGTDQNFNISIE